MEAFQILECREWPKRAFQEAGLRWRERTNALRNGEATHNGTNYKQTFPDYIACREDDVSFLSGRFPLIHGPSAFAAKLNLSKMFFPLLRDTGLPLRDSG